MIADVGNGILRPTRPATAMLTCWIYRKLPYVPFS